MDTDTKTQRVWQGIIYISRADDNPVEVRETELKKLAAGIVAEIKAMKERAAKAG